MLRIHRSSQQTTMQIVYSMQMQLLIKLDMLGLYIFWQGLGIYQVMANKQGVSEGFDSCDRPSNLIQIGFKSFIFHPVWPRN